MKPWLHSVSSAKKYGGKPEDYLPIHNKMDSSKAHEASHKHRCIFHSSFGIFLMEDIFGVNITNSDGNLVSVRDVAEQHVLEDLGNIPSFSDWMKSMKIEEWMGVHANKRRKKTGKHSFNLFEPKVQEQQKPTENEPYDDLRAINSLDIVD